MKRFGMLLSVVGLSLAFNGVAFATPVGGDAHWELSVNGEVVKSGEIRVDDKGNVTLPESVGFQGEGFSLTLDTLTANTDPFLIFGVGGTNNTDNPITFGFGFSIPINLGGMINAFSSVSYSVTDGAGDGATLFPTSGTGKVVDSQDIRVSPFLSTDKGVDVGDACTVGPPAGAYVCGPFNATNTFGSVGGPTYDLMSAIVAFGLTAHDSAGVSGRVSQTPVPEPGTVLLFGSGLLGLITFGRRAS